MKKPFREIPSVAGIITASLVTAVGMLFILGLI
jgi:hypothetical protein